MSGRRIVVDVGGTRSRFGISGAPGDLSEVLVYPTAGQASFTEALATYVIDIGAGPATGWCSGAYIAAAGPIGRGTVQLTNAAWSIAADEVARHLGGVPVTLVNDLEAVGLLLPHVQPSDVMPMGDVAQAALPGSRIAVNVGTGFGAATAVRSGGGNWAIAAGEAGHMALGLATAEEAGVLGFGRTVEDFLSGPGVGRLYAALADGPVLGDRPADAIFASAATDPAAARTVAVLSRLLGRVAGDLVLATAAWEGAFFCGSVARAWQEVADAHAFRAAFTDKGLMRARMVQVPTFLIVTPEPALLGLTYADQIAA